ncbi:MAG: histidine--tRNA ligase [Patescibacteria group bacterium]|nr:histidine--tRNA ligase [Patescibacteria group bacterium]
MNQKTKAQTLKGFRDILPEEIAIKKKAVSILVKVFESFGFQPVETPTLEYTDTLLGKYGQEADKLVYTFKDKGGRDVGLRYDLTVPICKVLSLYQNQIPLPFKRYQIQSAFRAEKPQRGRLREFTQCDIDIFGTASPLADAEIILVIYTALKKIGFQEFTININSRQILFKILNSAGIKNQKQQLSILRSIDKLDKKTKKEVENELYSKGLSKEQVSNLFSAIDNTLPGQDLKTIFDFLKLSKVPGKYYRFSPTMVRGLDYYTGTIFETYVTKPKIGSITGGGRYDNLVKQLGGPDIAATGTTIGLERIIEVIKEFNFWPNLKPCKTKVLTTIFSDSQALINTSIKITNKIRESGVAVELYPDPQTKLDKQLKYADKKGIPYALIIGPDEIKNNTVVLKDLIKKAQKELSLEEIGKILKI